MPQNHPPCISPGAVLVLGACALAHAAAPVPRFSNTGLADLTNPGLATGASTASAIAAPVGGQWSEVQRNAALVSGAVAGFAAHPAETAGTHRLADDFSVSGTAYGWSVSSISFYAYQTGAGPASPFASVNLRVWSGPPGDPGSSVLWGDTTTVLPTVVSALNVYRTFNSLAAPLAGPPDASRRVWELAVSTPGLVLAPGSYWLDWQIVPTSNQADAFCPPVTLLNQLGKPGANARQYKNAAGVAAWTGISDQAKPASASDVPQDLPFIIRAAAAPSSCPGDADQNGAVSFADITNVLINFLTQYPGSSGPGDADGDGQVSFSDITSVLLNFNNSCS